MRERRPVAYRGTIRPGVLVRPSLHTKAFVDRHLAGGGGTLELIQRMGAEIKGFKPFPLKHPDLRAVYARRPAEDIFEKRNAAVPGRDVDSDTSSVRGCVDKHVALVAALRELKERGEIDLLYVGDIEAGRQSRGGGLSKRVSLHQGGAMAGFQRPLDLPGR